MLNAIAEFHGSGNRVGHKRIGLVFNRTNYKQVVARDEFNRTGVYVLIGYSDDSTLPRVYVGEGDPVKARLDQHYSKKDFWDRAIFFVTKDGSLNKAHVKHLESRLLDLAKAAKQCKLDNSQTSLPPTLSEAETADIESFLSDMLSIFPLLGVEVFEKTEMSKKPHDLLFLTAKSLKAKGYESVKGFVVYRGRYMGGLRTCISEIDPAQPPRGMSSKSGSVTPGLTRTASPTLNFGGDFVFGMGFPPWVSAGPVRIVVAGGRFEKGKSGGLVFHMTIK